MNEKLYTLIEDYNLGRLAPEQLEAFEAAMKTDAALTAAVQAHRAEWEMQEIMAENLLRAQIRQTFTDQPPPDAKHWLLKNWAWTALTLLFLGIAGVLFFQKTPSESLPEITPPATLPADTVPARDTFAPKPNVPEVQPPQPLDPRKYAMAAYRFPDELTTTRGEETEDTLALANKAFIEKNFRRVLQLLATLPEEERQEALAIRAHAQFGAGRYADAARDFAELEKGGIYRREAQWFGLLAQMAAPGNDKRLWMKKLDEIRKDARHPYQKAAEGLWREIRSEK